MVAGMLYTDMLCPATMKHVMGKSYARGHGEQVAEIMVSAKADLEFVKMAVKELKTLEEKARPQKMDMSPVAAPAT